ncbi:MAG: hypothetical protein PVF63_09350, partial [Gammaproteobacteria bacterium]
MKNSGKKMMDKSLTKQTLTVLTFRGCAGPVDGALAGERPLSDHIAVIERPNCYSTLRPIPVLRITG